MDTATLAGAILNREVEAAPPAIPPGYDCEWFLLCENEATTTEPHPILGDVPICERCAAKVKANS